MKKFSIVQLVEDVIDVVAWKAYSKGIEIASFISPKIPTELLGDPNRLRYNNYQSMLIVKTNCSQRCLECSEIH